MSEKAKNLKELNPVGGKLMCELLLSKILNILQHVVLHYHDEISCFWYLMSKKEGLCSFIEEVNGPKQFLI